MKVNLSYLDALEYAKTVRWKVVECTSSHGECWCAMIAPEEELYDKDDNEIYMLTAGAMSKTFVKYIVDLHNKTLTNNE